MKDYIKKCKCQEKTKRTCLTDEPSDPLEKFGLDDVHLDETDDEGSILVSSTCTDPKLPKKKPVAKHELVFVSVMFP